MDSESELYDASYFDVDGHLNDSGVCIYADALKLGSEERLPGSILEHVESCVTCKQSIFQLTDSLKDHEFDRLGAHPRLSSEKKASKTAVVYFRAAAGIALIVGVAYILFFIWSGERETVPETERAGIEDEPIELVEPHDPSDPPEPTRPADDFPVERYAANFEPSIVFESLIDMQYRSYGIQIHSPGVGETAGDTLFFSGTVHYTGSIYLTILNNREEKLHSVDLGEIDYRYRADLDPGLYYWMLETDDDLLYAGKFIVPDGER